MVAAVLGGFGGGASPDLCRSQGTLEIRTTFYPYAFARFEDASPLDAQVPELATRFLICVIDFPAPGELQVRVRRPDGIELAKSLRLSYRSEPGTWEWTAASDDPVGTYTVTAIGAGGISKTATFEVRPPSAPRIAVLPSSGEPGTPFRVELAGFRSNQRVRLHLYRRGREFSGGAFGYLASTSVTVDESGRATYLLPTATDDEPGVYRIHSDPPFANDYREGGSQEFGLGSPGASEWPTPSVWPTPTLALTSPSTATSAPTRPTTSPPPPAKPKSGWVVQLALHAQRPLAEQVAAGAKQRGVAAEVRSAAQITATPPFQPGLWVVYAGPYSSRSEAESERTRIRNAGYPDAFLKEFLDVR